MITDLHREEVVLLPIGFEDISVEDQCKIKSFFESWSESHKRFLSDVTEEGNLQILVVLWDGYSDDPVGIGTSKRDSITNASRYLATKIFQIPDLSIENRNYDLILEQINIRYSFVNIAVKREYSIE